MRVCFWRVRGDYGQRCWPGGQNCAHVSDQRVGYVTEMKPIPIPRDPALLLAASVQRYGTDMMLTNGKGQPCGPWVIKRAILDARDKIDGLPDGFSFHDLRHYLASLPIASGADIKTVQARMRHASASTTLDIYGHLWPDADESTRTAIGAVIAERMAQTPAGALRTGGPSRRR